MIHAFWALAGIGIGFFFGAIYRYSDYVTSIDGILYDERKRTERWRSIAWKAIDANKEVSRN